MRAESIRAGSVSRGAVGGWRMGCLFGGAFLCAAALTVLACLPAVSWANDAASGSGSEESSTGARSGAHPATSSRKIESEGLRRKPRGQFSLLATDPDDPRGQPEVVLCSQNLNNLGDYAITRQRIDNSMTREGYEQKRRALVSRFTEAGCDIIAVQELLGNDEAAAKVTLDALAKLMRAKTGRVFDTLIGKTNDPISQVAFMYARDRAEALTSISYQRVMLPKITERERPRYFLRGPLEVQFSVRGRGDSQAKFLTVVNYHLKSKGGKERDPAELEWETYRMQMAEAIRRVVETRHAQSFASGETLLALVGDRNSNFDTASADILAGTLTLDNFKKDGGCRLTKRGVAFCSRRIHRPMRLFSVLLTDPQTKLLAGTFQYKQKFAWLDDIAMPHESLRAAWKHYAREGDYASFVVAEPPEASDHSMVGVILNW